MVGTKTVSVKLDSRLYTALKTRAELDKSNVSDVIRSLLCSALAAEELDLYGNEVAGFIRCVVEARMDVAHSISSASSTPPRTASPRSSRAP